MDIFKKVQMADTSWSKPKGSSRAIYKRVARSRLKALLQREAA